MMEQNAEDKVYINSLEDDDNGVDIKSILDFLWRLKWWMLLGLLITVPSAYIYKKLQVPVYQANSKALFIDYDSNTNDVSIMESITGISHEGRRDDEMILLKSPALMAKVISQLDLETRYYQYKIPIFHSSFPLFRNSLNVKQIEYYNDAPFSLDVVFDKFYTAEELPNRIEATIYAFDDKRYVLRHIKIGDAINSFDDDHYVHYGDTLRFPGCAITITSDHTSSMIKGDKFMAVYTEPTLLAEDFVSSLDVSLESGTSSMTTNILNFSYSDACPKRAIDILNVLVSEYNRDAKEFKSKSYISSIEFIDARLAEISKDLGNVESEFVNYQVANDYISSGDVAVTVGDDYTSQLVDLKMQKTILNMVKEALSNISETSFQVIPDITGLTDGGLTGTISQYNQLVIDRERLAMNSSENNPSVLKLNDQIKVARKSVDVAIQNLERIYQVKEKELDNLQKSARRARSYIPTRQRDLSHISRRQNIIEPIFLQLNQKREEVQLSMYTIPDNVRVIEPARIVSNPMESDSKKVFLIAVLLALLLPIGIVLLRTFLKTKVETKYDITKKINKPLLATIPKSIDSPIILSSKSRDLLTESFRMLRSNLKYLNKQVYQITSSVPGEGKSFVSANLAISLSHIGKKVAVVGLDLRHPSLKKYFPESYADHKVSVVKFLIGQCQDPALIPIRYNPPQLKGHSTTGGTLDIFFAGSIPPNPTELLSLDKLKELFEYLRNNYDYVICDSAPTLLVPDATIVNGYVDAALYVVRADYTKLSIIAEMSDFLKGNKFNDIYLILNDLDSFAIKYKYGYGYGYGYSYGYGYGYNYGYGYGYGSDPESDSDSDGELHHHHHHHHHHHEKPETFWVKVKNKVIKKK